MINNTQPKAMWLAEYLENCRREDAPVCSAAAELRRLHEVNQELLEALKLAQTIIGFGKEWDQIDAAIAKAEVTK